jgi:hypothetical protein
MYRNACSLQQQNNAWNRFGNLSGIRNRTRSGAVGGRRLCAGLAAYMSNPSAIVELEEGDVSAQNEGLARRLKGARPRLMQAVAEIKSNLSKIADEPERSVTSFMALLCQVTASFRALGRI